MKQFLILLAISWTLGCEGDSGGIDGLEISSGQCQDGEDNDGDDLVDCNDPDCAGFVFCLDAGAAGDADADSDSDTDVDSDSDMDAGADGGGKCLEGNYLVHNELDIAPLRKYSCITGGLTVDAKGLTHLRLPHLESIGGALSISNTALSSLDGLENLTGIGGGLSIEFNNALVNLDGLSNLAEAGGVVIKDNDVLEDVDGLGKLGGTFFSLEIHNNLLLANIDGLAGVTEITFALSIDNNASLTRIDLRNLESIGFTATFGGGLTGNDKLTDLNLSKLTSVVAEFKIAGNGALICDDDAIKAQVTAGSYFICFNSPADGCGPSLSCS